MKAKLVGLLTLFATISIVRSKILFAQFTLNPPALQDIKACGSIVNSIIKNAYTTYESLEVCNKELVQTFSTGFAQINSCSDATYYKVEGDIKQKCNQLKGYYDNWQKTKEAAKTNSSTKPDTCFQFQESLRKNLVENMFLFWTSLNSLRFFWLPDDIINGHDNDKLTGITFTEVKKDIFDYKAEISINGNTVIPAIKDVPYTDYNQELRSINVILDYNEFYNNIDYDKLDRTDSLRYTEEDPIYDTDALKIEDFYAKYRNQEDNLTHNAGISQFITDFYGGSNGALFQTKYRKQHLSADNDYLETICKAGYFYKDGNVNKQKFKIKTVRIQVTKNGIGKVHIDGEIEGRSIRI